MGDGETFTIKELKKDIEAIDEITKDWRQRMEFLPADQQFAMFRRAVTHLEKAESLIEKIMSRFPIAEDADESE